MPRGRTPARREIRWMKHYFQLTETEEKSMEEKKILELCGRYERLYVPAVADALDERGLWNQILSTDLVPLKLDQMVAGPAFTAKGHATIESDTGLGAQVLEGLTPGCVAVWDTSGENLTGHWGELMSNSAIARGCRGAIIDGGIRDTRYILEAGFPVWSKFRSPADARGRWTITDSNVPVMVSGVIIRPGDFVVADADGVVIVPKEIVEDVLVAAEKVVASEEEVRVAVREGKPLSDQYKKFKLHEVPPRYSL
jgi:4-hydroxy-4-methyl-2-oxoglutarate aldolase